MPGWGLDPYGLSPYGSVSGLTGGEVGTAPLIIYQDPAPGVINAAEDTLVTVTFFDVDLDAATIAIYINDSLVYDGTTGFAAGYLGIVQVLSSSVSVQIYKRGGWGYGRTVKVRGYAQDTTTLEVDATWSWTTTDNPVCYAGITPLPVETTLTQPLQRFIGVEQLRQHLFNVMLRRGIASISNDATKSARVLYQHAYLTELSVLQNAYLLKNNEALATTVCEQQSTLNIDKTFNGRLYLIHGAMNDFKNQRVLDERYIREFTDYLDTSLYHYRVSLAANLVLLAGAIETAEAA